MPADQEMMLGRFFSRWTHSLMRSTVASVHSGLSAMGSFQCSTWLSQEGSARKRLWVPWLSLSASDMT